MLLKQVIIYLWVEKILYSYFTVIDILGESTYLEGNRKGNNSIIGRTNISNKINPG